MRILKNTAERLFQEYAAKENWNLSKRGWPDFVVETKSGELFAVEVKPDVNSHPKKEQKKVHKFLRQHGIVTLVWSPDVGFRPE